MPSLVISQDTVSVHLHSKHLELVKNLKADEMGDGGFKKLNVPLVDIDRVVVCGRPAVTIPVLQRLMFMGIPTFFITSRGKWIGSISPDNNMNAERRIRQYELARKTEFSLRVATKIVFCKLRNSRRVLQRLASNRETSHQESHCDAVEQLKKLAETVVETENMEILRGYEGMGAAIYFGQLGKYFPKNIPFTTRNRRPPKDAANALLSWTYAIVQGEIDGAVRARGLDTCIGFLHATSHGTPSLALDLLEPLRSSCCDLLVLNILNHKHLTEDHFEYRDDDGGTYLTQEARKPFFNAYEMAMTRLFKPYNGDSHVDFRKVIDNMVVNILRAMEGDDNFEFFLMP